MPSLEPRGPASITTDPLKSTHGAARRSQYQRHRKWPHVARGGRSRPPGHSPAPGRPWSDRSIAPPILSTQRRGHYAIFNTRMSASSPGFATWTLQRWGEITKISFWTRAIEKRHGECISILLAVGRDPRTTIRSTPGFSPQLHLGGSTRSVAFVRRRTGTQQSNGGAGEGRGRGYVDFV